jgi:2-polyprenyl-6-methoxyphenol hydroxylase-like FAD-dependent oxidoreductase
LFEDVTLRESGHEKPRPERSLKDNRGMTASQLRALIVGGGIAGLASAVALGRNGWRVTVLEVADDFSEIGAGFGLTPNGVTALDSVGLGNDAVARSRPLTMTGIRDADGDWLVRFDPHAAYARNLRMFGMQRQVLHALLLAAAEKAELVTSVAVLDVQPGERDGAPATIRYRVDGVPRTVEANLVVGADGINSIVRAAVAPTTAVRYSGMSSWRGIATDSDLIGDDFTMTWGPRAEFGALRTSDAEVYWYGYAEMARGTRFHSEKRAAADRFGSWGTPIPELIEKTAAARVIRNDVFALARPAGRYVRGRAVLVGDAAHAMLPTTGQGVNTALEDAATLGRLVGSASDDRLGGALLEYQRVRRRRTRGIHRNSEAAGRFGSHLKSPLVRAVRNGLVRLVPPALSASASSSLFRWTPPGQS